MTTTRLKPSDRKDALLSAAVAEANAVGFGQMTRSGIAARAGVAPGLVTHYFETMPKLKRAVMRHAIHTEELGIVAEGVVTRDANALKAPPELQARALASMA